MAVVSAWRIDDTAIARPATASCSRGALNYSADHVALRRGPEGSYVVAGEAGEPSM